MKRSTLEYETRACVYNHTLSPGVVRDVFGEVGEQDCHVETNVFGWVKEPVFGYGVM